MTSKINTSALDVTYPKPGVNNSSQGFRDNFTSIKTNFASTKSEIEDLQSKVLLKSALTGTTLDNDMNNGIIKNAQTLQFRNSTYSLGSNLSGTVEVDCSLGDVHIGVVTGDIALAFSHWAPAGTQGSVEVVLGVAAGSKILIPDQVSIGIDTIEGYDTSTGAITVPDTVTRLHYEFNSLDCGTTIEIVPIDRPRITSQIDTVTRVTFGTPTLELTKLTVSGDVNGNVLTLTSNSSVANFNSAYFGNSLSNLTIFKSDGTKLGIATSVANATSLTLSTSLLDNITDETISCSSSRGQTGDIKGDIAFDADYLYICVEDFTSGSNGPIWSRTALNTSW
jgi:hypothetical protein